jgi:hypothetical protein
VQDTAPIYLFLGHLWSRNFLEIAVVRSNVPNLDSQVGGRRRRASRSQNADKLPESKGNDNYPDRAGHVVRLVVLRPIS